MMELFIDRGRLLIEKPKVCSINEYPPLTDIGLDSVILLHADIDRVKDFLDYYLASGWRVLRFPLSECDQPKDIVAFDAFMSLVVKEFELGKRILLSPVEMSTCLQSFFIQCLLIKTGCSKGKVRRLLKSIDLPFLGSESLSSYINIYKKYLKTK